MTTVADALVAQAEAMRSQAAALDVAAQAMREREGLRASELLTVRQVASVLQVNQKTVMALIVAGEVTASKVRRDWRVSSSSVTDYLLRTSNTAPRGRLEVV